MQNKIKQITLLDGKQFFYPTEKEIKNLSDQIATVIIEETMTKEEWDKLYFDIYNPTWYCDKCKIYHSKEHVCVRI